MKNQVNEKKTMLTKNTLGRFKSSEGSFRLKATNETITTSGAICTLPHR